MLSGWLVVQHLVDMLASRFLEVLSLVQKWLALEWNILESIFLKRDKMWYAGPQLIDGSWEPGMFLVDVFEGPWNYVDITWLRGHFDLLSASVYKLEFYKKVMLSLYFSLFPDKLNGFLIQKIEKDFEKTFLTAKYNLFCDWDALECFTYIAGYHQEWHGTSVLHTINWIDITDTRDMYDEVHSQFTVDISQYFHVLCCNRLKENIPKWAKLGTTIKAS